MAKPQNQDRPYAKDTAGASIEQLSRTLEALESRLSKLTEPAGRAMPTPPANFAAPSGPEPVRSHLAETASAIVMRDRMIAGDARVPASEAPREAAFDRRFRDLSLEVEALRAEGSSYSLMAEVAQELHHLRQEIRTGAERIDPRFETMRSAFDALRGMIDERGDVAAIGQEISRISSQLERLTEEGADRPMLNTLRAELEEMRNLVGGMAREQTVKAVGQRWDAFEIRYNDHAEQAVREQRDMKQELERLRDSLHSLASEDQLRAVERRWDEFEERCIEAASGASASGEQAISRILRDELDAMRQKLEGLASEAPSRAVEQHWGAVERRLDAQDVEGSIQRLAERMGEIETTLARLPETLSIAALEERVRSLAIGVDVLVRQAQQPELEQFRMLDERLDEISRAIVATSLQAPSFDTTAIERLEARMVALSTSIEEISSAGASAGREAEILSSRMNQLTAKVHELAETRLVDELAERVTSLSGRLDQAMSEMREPPFDADDIEARLSALTARLDASARPDVDPAMMASLEAQISRLSDHLTSSGRFSEEMDEEFDRRLAAVEQRLEDDRETLMEAARTAAEEAVMRMQSIGERESEHVARLADSLRSLEALARATDSRATQVFEGVHATLLKIVERLDLIEADLGQEAEDIAAAAAAVGGMFSVGNSASAVQAATASMGSPAPTMVSQPSPATAFQPMGRQAGALRAAASAAPAPSVRSGTGLQPVPHDPQGGASSAMFGRKGEMPVDEALASVNSVLASEMRERVDAPALDAADILDRREANRPLEPGSGAPDVAALLERVRAQQRGDAPVPSDPASKADFIAAARRAATAAASATQSEIDGARSEGDADAPAGSGLAAMLARRRKPILMAVGAVLLALMALPLGAKFLSSTSGDDLPRPAAQSSEDRGLPSAEALPAAAAAQTPTETPTETSAAPVETSLAPEPAPVETSAQTAPADVAPPTPGAMPDFAMPAEAAPAPPAPAVAVPRMEMTAGDATGGDLLGTAIARLPATAIGSVPEVPAGIAAPALASAAANGDPKALFEIGLRLLEGRKAEPRPVEALAWFARSASLGFAPAQYSLGTLYEKGNSVARDTIAARDWYMLAAEQGNVRAMHNLAVLYATGIDGKSEPETAARWFEKAADLGMRDSQYNLGILYARGSGVPQDLVQSYKWFAIVAAAGDKDAEGKRNEIARSLDSEQAKTAESIVAGWAQKPRVESANTVEIPKDWSDPAETTGSVDMTRAVRNVQAILTKLGYDAGTPDGVVGSKTRSAISAFQKAAGLTPSGKIDEPLIRALLERKDG